MKIGVLTYHRANNYGAYLQSYALTMKIRSLGYEAEIIDYNMRRAEEQYKVHNHNPIKWYNETIRRKMFMESLSKLPLSSNDLISDSIQDFGTFINGKYDAIVAGSDEIWKLDSFRGFPNPYWLLDNSNYQRFSYAASSRSDFAKLDKENLKIVVESLHKFSLIGVRDSYTYSEISRVLTSDTKIVMCCDPVFLYDFKPSKERGRMILEKKFGINSSKVLLGIMVNDEELAKKIKCEFKEKYELISLYRQWPGYKKTAQLTPFEWIDVIAALDILVSNYFHGVCFSILSNTYFVAIDSREKDVKRGKIYDLLSRNECLDSFLTTSDPHYVDKTLRLCENPKLCDYSKVVNRERQLGDGYFNIFVGTLV